MVLIYIYSIVNSLCFVGLYIHSLFSVSVKEKKKTQHPNLQIKVLRGLTTDIVEN